MPLCIIITPFCIIFYFLPISDLALKPLFGYVNHRIQSACPFKPTCAYARWAHMCHFPSVFDLTKDQTRK